MSTFIAIVREKRSDLILYKTTFIKNLLIQKTTKKIVLWMEKKKKRQVLILSSLLPFLHLYISFFILTLSSIPSIYATRWRWGGGVIEIAAHLTNIPKLDNMYFIKCHPQGLLPFTPPSRSTNACIKHNTREKKV